MPYLELSFDLSDHLPEAVEAACFDTGALSVTFSDARDEAVLEPRPGEIRLWRNTRMHALYDAKLASAQLIATLAQKIGIAPQALSASAVADRLWEREWLRDFHSMRFGRRLWICPKHESVSEHGAIVVRLDPGLAFGTGTHASTAMCLQWLDSVPLQDLQIVDYGCGSGVLAIAALKLGARHAYAFDIDPQALLATGENAAENGVADRLTICATPGSIPDGRGVLLANILASTLIELAGDLAQTLRSGGRCVLSGILAEQEAEVADAFKRWFAMQRFAQQDGWVSLSGSRTE
jgi:ribosomal protein L11 methyltransferase